jgi:ketosteroid isomerase-like protein
MASAGRQDDVLSLHAINVQLTDWERIGASARPSVAAVLDAQFLFRRGNGTVVGKEEYLATIGQPTDRNDELWTRITQIQVWGRQALVEAHVYLDGSRGGQQVKGWFRNVRVWEKQQDDQWRCVFWFNRLIDSGKIAPAQDAAGKAVS